MTWMILWSFCYFLICKETKANVLAKVRDTVKLQCGNKTFEEPVDWRYQKDATIDEDYVCTATNQGVTRCDHYFNWPRIHVNVSTPGDYMLIIDNVTVNDSGLYHCVEGGAGTRHTTELKVSVPECDSNPCQNHGTCTVGVDWYTCVCSVGWTGINCESAPKTETNAVARLSIGLGWFAALLLTTCTAAIVINTLSTSSPVHGVTLVGNELFVLCEGDKDQIVVYDTADNFNLLRKLTVKGLRRDVQSHFGDMTYCCKTGCLYIYVPCSESITRLRFGEVSKWSVGASLRSLSVTFDFNLLVTCSEARELKLFTTNGELLRVVSLPSAIVWPCHAIQLCTDQFIVSHGRLTDSIHRVCQVDAANGEITLSYGFERGSYNGRLDESTHLAVDKDGSIFVADFTNNRVLVLNSKLSYVRTIASRALNHPYRLCIDEDRRLLYVGPYKLGEELAVVQLAVSGAGNVSNSHLLCDKQMEVSQFLPVGASGSD